MNIAILGGGGHSRGNHLPAVQRFNRLHPGAIELAAFCDLDAHTAAEVADAYGFARHYTDLDAMLAAERLDACIAVTPVDATARIAEIILTAGVPLLMEKPPGATPAQTRHVCDVVERLNAHAMVSMNRRFDPALAAARDWFGDRPLRHLRASMLRNARSEPGFMSDTAIHCVDAVRSIAGDIRDYAVRARQIDGVWWYHLSVDFVSGATGTIDIMPTCGVQAEFYELLGTDARVVARVAEFDDGTLTAWERGQLVLQHNPTDGQPLYVRNGAYAETEAFFASLKDARRPYPTPADVRPSVELCHAVRDRVQEKSS